MAIYLDSAKIQEAKTAAQTGWVIGITTNPTLLAQSDTSPQDTLTKLAELPVKEIYYQVTSSTFEKMSSELENAKNLLGEKLVVKIPPTEVGFRFAASISRDYKTCLTAIYTPAQALVAREIGTRYIAVYVNRATRLLGDGIKLTQSIAEVLRGSQTEILAASLKSPEEAIQAFKAGGHHLALPFEVLTSLIDNPHSTQAVDQFEQSGSFL